MLGPRRIVVPVSGGAVDADALRTACRLARPAKAEIMVITVLEVPRHLPLSAHLAEELGAAEETLGELEQLAAELGTKVQTQILQTRDAGPALVDEALRWDADLVVVGLGAPPQFGEFNLGRVGQELLNRVHCRLIMIREALEADQERRAVSVPEGPD